MEAIRLYGYLGSTPWNLQKKCFSFLKNAYFCIKLFSVHFEGDSKLSHCIRIAPLTATKIQWVTVGVGNYFHCSPILIIMAYEKTHFIECIYSLNRYLLSTNYMPPSRDSSV